MNEPCLMAAVCLLALTAIPAARAAETLTPAVSIFYNEELHAPINRWVSR